MGFADRSGYAVTDARNPRAFAVCDECGAWHNRFRLQEQMEFAGDGLINQHRLVCPRCISKPQEQFRTPILPADPVPIDDPRPETPELNQNLDGFVQITGPRGASLHQPILTELDPTRPFTSKAAVLASAGTGWGLPQPTLTDRGGAVTLSGVPIQLMPANLNRQYLLVYNPSGAIVGIAQGRPILGNPATVIVGAGSAVLQNAMGAPTTVWKAAVYALGLIAGAQVWAWEG
jgi:hypothetical protein